MSIDIDRFLTETASKLVTTRNKFGDVDYGATSESLCLYKDLSTLEQQANREETNLDGWLYLKASETVVRGDIYYHADEGYLRIEKIYKPKRNVIDQSVQWKKCEVSKQRQIS